MVKKLLTLALGLTLATGLVAQPTINESDVQFWAGSGPNSSVVCIGWDDGTAAYTPTVVVWGVRWNGSIHLIDALDSIATYDEHFTYSMSGSFLSWVRYDDPSAGIELTPSGFNCNSYNAAYGSGTMNSTWLHISTSTCGNYNHSGITNVIYPVDPAVASTCPRPLSVAVSNVTATAADFAITDTAGTANYCARLLVGTTMVDSLLTTSTSGSFSGLTANTAYTVEVVAICPDGTYTYPIRTPFRTPCVTVQHTDLPWSENFNALNGHVTASQTAAFINNLFCWTVPNPPTYSFLYINSSTTYSSDGGSCVYVGGASNRHPLMVLPEFEDSPDQLMLTLDVRSAYSRSGVEVGVVTDPTDETTFIPIAVCEPGAGTGWETFSVTFAGRSTGRMAIRGRNSAACIDNVVVEELAGCVKPSQVTVSSIDAYSATLNIADPNGSTHFIVRTSAGDSLEIFSNTYTLSGLEPSTLYTVMVHTLCSDSLTGATSTTFRTGCGPIQVPLHEDFTSYEDLSNGYSDAVAGGMMPCWQYFKSSTGGYVALFNASHSSTYAFPTGYSLKIVPSAAGSKDVFVMPETADDISGLELAMSTRSYNASSGTFDVGYLTDATDTTTFVVVRTLTASDYYGPYQQETFTFASAPSGARMAMRHNANTTSGWWYVADFDIHAAPLCQRIEGVRVDSVSATTISFTVSDASDNGSYRYIIASGEWSDTVDFNDTVYTIEDLAPATSYTLQVSSVCSDGNATMSRPAEASTLCIPVATLPYVVDFESWPAGAAEGMDRCWNRVYSNIGTIAYNNYPYVVINSSTSYSGEKSLKLYSYYSNATRNIYSAFFLPEFDEPVNTLKVSFMHKAGNTQFNKLRLLVGVSSATDDTTTFTRVATIIPASNDWEEYEVELNGYAGTGSRITIIQASTASTYITSYIDDVMVDTVSSCNRPATFGVDSITAHEATLTWYDPAHVGDYIVRWTDGTTADSALVSDTSYTLTQLSPATTYNVEVSTFCYGNPTRPRTANFKTGCAVIDMPWIMNFDAVDAAADLFPCWSMHTGLFNDATGTATLGNSTSAWTRVTTALGSSPHFKVNIYGSINRWMVTPPVNIEGNAELKFDYALTKYNTTQAIDTAASGLADDRFMVLATADSGAHWTVLAQWSDTTSYRYRAIPATGDSATLSLAAFAGQAIRIAFYGESTANGADNDLHVDNIQVVYGSAEPVDTVQPTPMVLCDSVHALPYEIDFSGYTLATNGRPFVAAAPLPDCWTVVGNGRFTADYDTTADASLWFSGIGTASSINNYGCVTVNDPFFSFIAYGNYDGTYPTFVANQQNYGTRKYAVLPPFDQALSGTRLTFDHRTSARNGAALLVGYIVNDTSDFVAVDSIPTDYRVLHHDTIDFTQLDSIPADARLTFLWKSTDTIHMNDAPGNYFCGIDNLKVSLVTNDTTTPADTTVAPVDATIAASDILYWVGSGPAEAILVVMDGTNARAWGYRFDPSDDVTAMDMAVDIDAADHRLVYTILDYTTYEMGFAYKEYPVEIVVPDTRFKVDGVLADDGDMLSDYDLYNGAVVVVSSIAADLWATSIVPATVAARPVDATIAMDDVTCWLGEGENSAVVAINWGSPDTALAWGLHFSGTPTIQQAIVDLANADPRLSVDNPLAIADITYSSDNTNLSFQTSMPGNYLQFILNGNSNAGWSTVVTDGSFLKIGESAFGTGIDSIPYAGQWFPMGGVVWSTEIHPVDAIDTTTPSDTTITPATDPVDATIAFSDILYWVGSGSDSAAFIVSFGQPDTAFAWGFLFNGSATAQVMVDSIAAADPRFWVDGDPSSGGDIHFVLENGDTLGLSPVNPAVGYNFWWTNLNGLSTFGTSTALQNGDVFKFGDINSATPWDFQYGYNMQNAWEKAPTPVSVPDTTGGNPGPGPGPDPEHGPFCGPVGTEGCNAIAADSSVFVAWATGCTVERGPQNISVANSPMVDHGEIEYVFGPVSLTDNINVLSLGDGGSATLTFDYPITNGDGPDFAVFENSFNDSFLELAFVEVSSDGERFVRFPATSLTQTHTQTSSTGNTDPTFINNLAGKFRRGYGTPFDLEELRDSVGINIDSITHVRIVDVVGSINPQYGTYDAFGHIINDPWPTPGPSGGFDLAGVGVIHHTDTTTVGIADAVAEVEHVWPNPTADVLNVSVSRPVEAALYDLTGRPVGRFSLTAGIQVLDLSGLPAGVYMLRAGGSVTKIVKR
ncbi:MAG: choice-of-anchor J domain-containing protein [Bacteroidales bacterium]|nr:choice-of-anchor J domain-containing protein [Bacteroidales bacterium]